MHTTFSSQVSMILTRYASFDKFVNQVDAVSLNAPLFTGLLEDAPVDHLELLGKTIGPHLIKRAFTVLDLPYNLDGLIDHYFKPMSSYSKWYTFTIAGTGANRKLMFQHTHGPKCSALLKVYISNIIKSATGSEPRVVADHRLVTVYC